MKQDYTVLPLIESLIGRGKKLNRGEVAFFCPSCHHRKPKLQVNLDRSSKTFGKWHCWICSETHSTKGKNLFTLFKKFNASRDQVRELASLLGQRVRISNEPTVKKLVSLPKQYIPLWQESNELGRRHALVYLARRGFGIDDIIKYGIGYCEDGEYRNRIIIPSFDKDARLNYFIARSYFDNTSLKYLNPEVEKSEIILFEIFINFDLPVTVVEGIFDAMKVRHNAVPILGKSVPDALIKRLTENHTSVNIYFDPDAKLTSLKIAEKLINAGLEAFIVDPDPQRDPGEMTTYANKLLIEDRRQPMMQDFVRAGLK